MTDQNPWRILPAIVGWVATNGTIGAWAATRTEAELFAEQKRGEASLEWGAIETALDRMTGLTYACRHHDHHVCPAGAYGCACTCHKEAA